MSRRFALRSALALASLGACNDPAATTDSGSTTTGSTSTASTDTTDSSSTAGTTAPTTGGTSSGSSSTGATATGFDPPVAMCGNGYLEDDEECDDGNAADDDGCNSACLVPCGLETQIVALSPSAESDLWAVAVAPAPDGGFMVVARQREIVSNEEGTQTIGLTYPRVLRYSPEGRAMWDVLLDEARAFPVGGVADAAGDLYIAATIAGMDEDDVQVVKLAGSDGHVLWDITHDGSEPMSVDTAAGIALAPDGDVVVSGSVVDVPAGADVWVRKLDPSDGGEIWTTTWSGPGNGMFSADEAGRIAVGEDGTIYVGAREYVEYNIGEAVLLKFPGDGGPAEWVFAPKADGSEHRHGPGWVAVDGAGDVVFSAIRLSGAVNDFWVYKLGADKTVQWEKALVDFQDAGEDWSIAGSVFASDGGVVVSGSYVVEDKMANLEWIEAWLARLNSDGTPRCQIHYRAPSPDLLPPSVFAYDTVAGPAAEAYVGGQIVDAGEQQLWVGRFRP